MFTFFLIILITLLINLILISTIIVLEKKRPEKTLAWVLILLLIPPIGLILYIFLGRNWKVNTLDKKEYTKVKDLITPLIFQDKYNSLLEYKPLIDLIAITSNSPFFINNDVEILDGGIEKFEKLKIELNNAKHTIHLEYYIVKDDSIGNEIKDILIRKASEGIKIKFIIDRVGSIRLKKQYIKDLQNAGIDVVFYSYVLAPLLRSINTQINYRNHRKIVVIDNYVGFIGGINIGDEYIGHGPLGEWRDCHLMIKGDFVLGLQSVLLDDYSTIKKISNDEIESASTISKYFSQPTCLGTVSMQFAKSGPDSQFPSIMQAMIKMISLAKNEINIITPYFIPSEALMDSIRISSLSGVKISIIFPDKPDHLSVNKASRTFLAELSRCGCKIYLYSTKGFVHSKILTIDNKICTVGTANMDIRSFELNYEINAFIYDSKITNNLNKLFYSYLSNCREFQIKEYDSLSFPHKLINGFFRLLSSIL